MADELTQEEIDAIAAYTGPIEKINRGRSGIPLESVNWLDGNKSFARRYNRQQKFVVSRERDLIIREMVQQGATISDMARATNLTRKAVKARIERMKLDY